MTAEQQKYLFIGCGNMAKALIQGLLANAVPASHIMASCPRPEKHQAFAEQSKIHISRDLLALTQQASVIILAVKPAVIPVVLKQLSSLDLSQHIIISVAAGIQCQQIESGIQSTSTIIRAMPNTPASIGQGATGLFVGVKADESQKLIATNLFKAVGTVTWVTSESQIDLVTAIAGSSPAYCFMFIQAMADQAQALGMPETSARQLATQALLGAAKLAQANPDVELQQMIDAVTSKGGTTEAAIASLKLDHFTDSIKNAVKSAYQRAQQLGETQ
ncbi:MAG: pyrroline-5-carboxylate reductase [Enterobacterales bacterium]|nr:pyrroline-5-carboxylate reductase [Enterobacterales bacterium]